MISCPFCDHKNPPGAVRCADCGAELPRVAEDEARAGAGSGTDSIDDRLIKLVQNGQKIAAIKLYRETTGAGLKEAKDAVEALETGQPQPAAEVAGGLEHDVLVLLRAGQKIPAIKLYRDKTGAGLADSKKAVEAIAGRNGIQSANSGCGTSVLSLLAIVLVVIYFIS